MNDEQSTLFKRAEKFFSRWLGLSSKKKLTAMKNTAKSEEKNADAKHSEHKADSPAQDVINNLVEQLKEPALAQTKAAKNAKKLTEESLQGKEEDFHFAEESVDAYEYLLNYCDDKELNKNANVLAKMAEKAAEEVDADLVKVAGLNKAISAAKTSIQASKDKLSAADKAASDLWDFVRRDMASDLHVKKIQGKISNLSDVIKDYSEKIQEASDFMNKALAKIGGTISADRLKEQATKAKAHSNELKANILANLDFSKEKLKKKHADWMVAKAADEAAQYDLENAKNIFDEGEDGAIPDLGRLLLKK